MAILHQGGNSYSFGTSGDTWPGDCYLERIIVTQQGGTTPQTISFRQGFEDGTSGALVLNTSSVPDDTVIFDYGGHRMKNLRMTATPADSCVVVVQVA